MNIDTEAERQNADERNVVDAVRCPNCDSVIDESAERCLMCGYEVSVAQSGVITSRLIERQSKIMWWITGIIAIVVIVAAIMIMKNPSAASVAIFPTATELPPTMTWTPTNATTASEQPIASASPEATPTAAPTETPRSPRQHTVGAGETLFGLGLRFGVTSDSIAEVNGLPANAGLQVNQELMIPWPTATPPLVPVELEVAGEIIVADPTDCNMYEIKGGDTFLGIAQRERIDLSAMIAVNRLTEQSILQPGDQICIPKIIRSGFLPPTPGPSPTASSTSPPGGPQLLYPGQNAVLDPPESPFFLQWAAVKTLEEDEWYMIEVTDLSAVDAHPRRAFTRQTSFQVPGDWRPSVPESHLYRWRISIVKETGRRDDGAFIYTFGGNSSGDGFFYWLGAYPIPTSTPSTTPTLAP